MIGLLLLPIVVSIPALASGGGESAGGPPPDAVKKDGAEPEKKVEKARDVYYKTEGVVVTAVEPGSAADEAGIRRGDVIVEVDRKPIRSLDEYKKTVAAIRKGKGVLFLVRRGESTLFLALKPQR